MPSSTIDSHTSTEALTGNWVVIEPRSPAPAHIGFAPLAETPRSSTFNNGHHRFSSLPYYNNGLGLNNNRISYIPSPSRMSYNPYNNNRASTVTYRTHLADNGKRQPYKYDRPILVLSVINLLTSVAVFILSLFDAGRPLFYINLAISGASALFFMVIFMLRIRHAQLRSENNDFKKLETPVYGVPAEVLAYLVSLSWLGPLGLAIVGSIPGGVLEKALGLEQMGKGKTLIFVGQGVLSVFNFILAGSVAIMLGIERRRYDKVRDVALFKEFAIE